MTDTFEESGSDDGAVYLNNADLDLTLDPQVEGEDVGDVTLPIPGGQAPHDPHAPDQGEMGSE